MGAVIAISQAKTSESQAPMPTSGASAPVISVAPAWPITRMPMITNPTATSRLTVLVASAKRPRLMRMGLARRLRIRSGRLSHSSAITNRGITIPNT